MLSEGLITHDWQGFDGDIAAPPGSRLEAGHQFSAFHLDDILSDPVSYARRDIESGFRVNDTAELALWYLLGVSSSEPEHILYRGGVYLHYAKLLVERLSKGRDTGLAHPELLGIWEGLSDDQKDKVSTLLFNAADTLDDFPNIGKMNVVFNNVPVHVDIGPVMPEMFIPAVVETRSGMAAVIPTLAGLAGLKTRAVSGAITASVGRVNGAEINQYHIWDLSLSKIRQGKREDTDKAIALISAMASA